MFREFAMLEAALAQKMQPAEKILTATILGARASGKTRMEKFENHFYKLELNVVWKKY